MTPSFISPECYFTYPQEIRILLSLFPSIASNFCRARTLFPIATDIMDFPDSIFKNGLSASLPSILTSPLFCRRYRLFCYSFTHWENGVWIMLGKALILWNKKAVAVLKAELPQRTSSKRRPRTLHHQQNDTDRQDVRADGEKGHSCLGGTQLTGVTLLSTWFWGSLTLKEVNLLSCQETITVILKYSKSRPSRSFLI